mmetsp:Transcript_59870/g.129786  ORF Transcript_59870/g.129786 Transcript_59870/m.129786 type:complete len:548 (-) Transcript_59870:193-1836(-)
MRLLVLTAAALAVAGYASQEADAAGEGETSPGSSPEEDSKTKPYVAPQVEGLHWVETFDGDVWSRWTPSSNERYNGRFTVEKRKQEALVGDVGLLVPAEAKHYGVATVFAPLEGKPDVPFVIQLEVKFQDGLTCGGSYVKLFNSESGQARDFDNETPYVIMFGPDRCGATDKVHFILRHKSPKTQEWEEKHFKDPPNVPHDQLSHLYGLVINPDNTFEIQIDGQRKAEGSLLTSMQPPVNPPKEIDDPFDKKPADWVEEAMMDDPEASKPDDWDEDEPSTIVDTDVQMPAGWREDAEPKIADPAASRPDDWDDEEDGEWEPPMIPNPDCKVGCGKWKPPMKSNPKYKGKWHAPRIDNPDYKGIWKPKQVPNPNYFVDEAPCVLPRINAVGIDIWTMNGGILFDNMLLSTSVEAATSFADQSWRLRSQLEELQKPSRKKGGIFEMIKGDIVPLCITATAIVLATLWCCCMRSGVPPPPKPARSDNAKSEKKESRAASAKEGTSSESSKKAAEDDSTKNGGKSQQEKEEKPKAKKPEEGGLGDIDSGDS